MGFSSHSSASILAMAASLGFGAVHGSFAKVTVRIVQQLASEDQWGMGEGGLCTSVASWTCLWTHGMLPFIGDIGVITMQFES